MAAACAVAVVVAGGGVAYATGDLPGQEEMIHACYGPSGHLRVVDAAADCRHHEKSISWNEQGPRGLTGARGPAGPAGPAGASGPATGCAPDLTKVPTLGSGQVAEDAYLDIGGQAYPVSRFEVGAPNCPTPLTTITVAGPTDTRSGKVPVGGTQTLLRLLTKDTLSGKLVATDADLSPIAQFSFTGGKVSSFSDTNGLVQLTITAASITAAAS